MDAKSTSEIQLIADEAATKVCARQAELCGMRMQLTRQQMDNIEETVGQQTGAIDKLTDQVTAFKEDMTDQVAALKVTMTGQVASLSTEMARQNSALVLDIAGLKQKWTIWPTLVTLIGSIATVAGIIAFVINLFR
jgi:hypothetical protein